MEPHKLPSRLALITTGIILLAWFVGLFDWVGTKTLPRLIHGLVDLSASLAALWWFVWSRTKSVPTRYAVASIGYLVWWQSAVWACDVLDLPAARSGLATYGVLGAFLIGLAWAIWWVERLSQRYEANDEPEQQPKVWNPLHPRAWYYGAVNSQRLNQSITVLGSYSLLFLVLATAVSQLNGCREVYELPGGGGGSQMKSIAQTIKVQKVQKKKFVINPFSAIVFNPPPIDEVKLQLVELTEHVYRVGQGGKGGFGFGEGDGSGFGGPGAGKVRFIRLEYPGGDWDQDFGIGADLNLLVEYGVRTGQKVADQTESRPVAQLANFPAGKSPPLVYLTGQRSITLPKPELKILREYLIDKHGMLFGDNGGSWHFHAQFFDMMRQVLPQVEPVHVPLDDVIHRIPYQLPFLPFVAPHAGREAWGWKVDGRWVCYYHPGDIGDAWSDGHSGVPRDVWEACYQLGVNVIFYAHMEYAKWLQARSK